MHGRPTTGHGVKTLVSPPLNSLTPSQKKEKAIASSKRSFDYLTCSWRELEDRILGYTSHPAEVPREILSHECTLDEFSLRRYYSYHCIALPYALRSALDNERPFFPVGGEIEIYLGHFMAGLRFPIDPDFKFSNFLKFPYVAIPPVYWVYDKFPLPLLFEKASFLCRYLPFFLLL